ncbi:cytidylate kinase-like family protein [Salmonella enterica]|nr:cytidylate kinase-like family protein [Salmonella enterica]
MIFTIGRQVGSGGRLVGKIIAQRLGLEFYDAEILQMAAKESGIKDEFFERSDERNSLWARFTSFFMSDHLLPAENCLSPQSLFKFQSDAIRQAAQRAPGAVFVGRCSDYILRDFPDRVDVFISARMENRVKRASHYYDVSEEEAARKIADMESARADYYNFYTEKTWGMASSYHVCVDSTDLTIEQVADVIINFAKLTGKLRQ